MEHLPFDDRPFRHAMGLKPLDEARWIEVDEHYAAQLALKAALLRERHDEVVAALPGTEAAGDEVLRTLAAHMAHHHPHEVQVEGDRVANAVTGERWRLAEPGMHPIDCAGRLVQEDLCLMTPSPAGDQYVLGAASVCFPARWDLRAKLGLSTTDIHRPVPRYDERLAGPVDTVLRRLKVGRPVWRVNWSVNDDPALFQPTGHGRAQHNQTVTEGNAGDHLWLRVERQTLRRFPSSGAVLLTVRTHQQPLATLGGRPEVAARLAAAIRNLPDDVATYKSLPTVADAALAWLDQRSSTA